MIYRLNLYPGEGVVSSTDQRLLLDLLLKLV
jgi:hypothetical protein